MEAELRDSLENLYPDSIHCNPLCRALTVDVARGGTAAVHVFLTGLTPGDVGCRIREEGRDSREARLFRLIDVPVEDNTGLVGFTEGSTGMHRNAPNHYVIRRAPFRTYDAMEPVKGPVRVSGPVMALRVHVPIPCSGRIGTRSLVITVVSGRESASLRLGVRVHKAVIPAVGRESFAVTNWFSYENVATRHGLKMWSEPYWKMLGQYARLMAHGRQNAFWIPLSCVFTLKAGSLILDRAKLRRIVATFTRAGLYFIEGGHVAGRTGGKWEAKTFDVVIAGVRATEPEGNRHLSAIGRQLMEEIDRNGWRERWIQHVTDEPTANNSADYRILTGMVRKVMPGLPILDATMDPALVGSVDIWCPQVQEYQRHRAAFEAQRRLGDRVWYYTCCFPGGPWLNRLLDQELLRPALLGWAGALFGLDGFLHWGFNHYRKEQDPFKKNVLEKWGGGANALPPGDTHIAYPGRGAPWSSLRLESHREGFEDCELLRQLKTRNQRLAFSIARKALRGFDDFVKTVRPFRAARRALLTA